MAGDAAIVNTVGVTLVEISIAVFLYGIATMQALVYWAKYRDDARWIRFGVVWEWFLETVHTVLCLHLIYSYTVFDWGDMEKTESIVWSFTASCFLAVFVAVFVQGFLGWRVYLLSKQDWRVILPLVLLLLMRATFGCCSISVMGMSKTWDHWRSLPYGRALLACALSSAAATDLYTWILLLYCLRRAQKTTRRTATLMKRLQIYVVSSGCLTMFISVTIILTFALMQSNLLFAGLIQIQSKLYANCFFASLNARMLWRADFADTSSGAVSMEVVGASGKPSLGQTYPRDMRRIEVFQSITHTTDGPGSTLGNQGKPALSMSESQDDEECKISTRNSLVIG